MAEATGRLPLSSWGQICPNLLGAAQANVMRGAISSQMMPRTVAVSPALALDAVIAQGFRQGIVPKFEREDPGDAF
jgi:hypothetical protein